MKAAARKIIAITSCCAACTTTGAFLHSSTTTSQAWSIIIAKSRRHTDMNTLQATVGFGKTKELEPTASTEPPTSSSTTEEQDLGTEGAKRELLEIIPHMTGKDPTQNARVETLINYLESQYQQCHTIDFFNLAIGGEWQFIFSTNMKNGVPRDLRLSSLTQVVEGDGYQGKVTNLADFEMQYSKEGEEEEQQESAYEGTFSIASGYEMVDQSTRMSLQLTGHTVRDITGGPQVPDGDVIQRLCSMLIRALPFELFDPNDLLVDTTYVDGDVRIVRHSGSVKLEGVRNIFVRV